MTNGAETFLHKKISLFQKPNEREKIIATKLKIRFTFILITIIIMMVTRRENPEKIRFRDWNERN